MIINECYLCKDNTYIIINYNNNKIIEHEKVDKLSKIFTREYSNFELKDISGLKLFSQVYSDAMIGGI